MLRNVALLIAGILGTLFVQGARAQTPFEDDGTQQMFGNTSVHVCSSGAMFGVDPQNNRFMCLDGVNIGPPAVDAGTQASFFYSGGSHSVHVCPSGSVMVGWHKGENWLICDGTDVFTVSPHVDTGTQGIEPNHADTQVHICDQSDAHSVMAYGPKTGLC